MKAKASFQLEELQEGQEFAAVVAAVLAIPVMLTLLAVIWLRSQEERTSLKPIVLATGEYEPYTGKDLGDQGLATAVVDATFREMGYEPAYVYLPWNHVSNSVARNERMDGIRAGFPYLNIGARTNVFLFSSEAIVTVGISLFVKSNARPIATIEDLAGHRFILQDGYEYPPGIREAATRRSIPILTNSTADAFRLLLESEIPLVVPEATDVGWKAIRRHFPDRTGAFRAVRPAGVPTENSLYLIASRRNPHNRRLLRQFDQRLRALKSDGTYDSLLNRADAPQSSRALVRLFPSDGASMLRAESDQGPFLVPSGTPAEILRWGNQFYPPGHDAAATDARDSPGTRVTVRLLGGPMTGAVASIDGAAARFEFERTP